VIVLCFALVLLVLFGTLLVSSFLLSPADSFDDADAALDAVGVSLRRRTLAIFWLAFTVTSVVVLFLLWPALAFERLTMVSRDTGLCLCLCPCTVATVSSFVFVAASGLADFAFAVSSDLPDASMMSVCCC